MKLKPQVLDKYLSKRVEEKELQINKNRVHDDDFLFIEDDGTRTELTGTALPVNQLVSGEYNISSRPSMFSRHFQECVSP